LFSTVFTLIFSVFSLNIENSVTNYTGNEFCKDCHTGSDVQFTAIRQLNIVIIGQDIVPNVATTSITLLVNETDSFVQVFFAIYHILFFLQVVYCMSCFWVYFGKSSVCGTI